LVVDIDLLPRENGEDKADALGKESGGKSSSSEKTTPATLCAKELMLD
jgi:hypothetical protein